MPPSSRPLCWRRRRRLTLQTGSEEDGDDEADAEDCGETQLHLPAEGRQGNAFRRVEGRNQKVVKELAHQDEDGDGQLERRSHAAFPSSQDNYPTLHAIIDHGGTVHGAHCGGKAQTQTQQRSPEEDPPEVRHENGYNRHNRCHHSHH